MSELAGKLALVTGAARGIGAGIALALADQGADVAITYERSTERAAALVEEIEGKGRRAFAIRADSADAAAARELGPLGITVNLVQPGPIDTDLNPANGDLAGINLPFLALGRYGTTAEIGHAVAFLASPAANYVTGSVLTVDGGFNA